MKAVAAVVLPLLFGVGPPPGESGLLFYRSGDRGLTADHAAGGDAAPDFVNDEVKIVAGGAKGSYLQCGRHQVLFYWAPGNIYAQRGTLSFYWRSPGTRRAAFASTSTETGPERLQLRPRRRYRRDPDLRPDAFRRQHCHARARLGVANDSGQRAGPAWGPQLVPSTVAGLRFLEQLYANQIEAAALREYINTEGSLWIDRVGVWNTELQRARLGGSALVRNSIVPGHVVSWRFEAPASHQSVAILIPQNRRRSAHD